MPDILAAPLLVASQALALALLALTAYAAGRLLTRRLPVAPGIERAAVSATIGLAALAHVALLLGLVGRLTRPSLLAALAAIHLLAWRSWRDLAEDWRAFAWSVPYAFLPPGGAAVGEGGRTGGGRVRRPNRPPPSLPPAPTSPLPGGRNSVVPSPPTSSVETTLGIDRRRSLAVRIAVAIVLVAPFFLLSLYPPTAFDATLYHLPMARAFAASGGLPFLPHLRFPVFPQLQELLFAAMLLLDRGIGRGVGAQLVELLATLLTAALLWGWTARGEREDGSGASGRLAAAAFLGNPIVVGIGTAALVEPGLALFAAASFHAAFRYGESRARGWAALAGGAGAAAAATKYLGLWFLAIAGLAMFLSPRAAGGGSSARRRAADLLVFAAVALAVLLPWYGRIVHLTGNPVFPFLSAAFGASPWRPPAYDTMEMRPAGLAGLLRLPWDTLFARCRAGCEPPLSPAYLLALPLLAAAAWRDRPARWALGVALAVVLFYPFAPPDARYLLPALPPLSWALGRALNAPLAVGSPRRLAAGISRRLTAAMLLLLAPGWAYAVYRLARQGPPPATAAASERYLAAQLPMYPAVADLNRRCGDRYTVYGFFAENMRYYAAGTFLGDWNGPERYGEVFPLLAQPDALADRLVRFGAGFALVPRAQGAFRMPAAPAWSRRFRPFYSDRAAQVFALGGGQPASTVCQR